MSLTRDRRNKGALSERRASRREDVNPMNYISNLADAMLVLAVGIMVALVLHWNVDLQSSEAKDADKTKASTTFSQEDLSDREEIPDNASRAGEVYYDEETETYYVVDESGTQETDGE